VPISGSDQLTEGEVAAILAAAQDAKAIVIGGQSVAIWARRYADKFPREISPITSSDVDFLGSAKAAKIVAARLGGRICIPLPDDATTNTAIVTAAVGQHSVRIDFMSHIVWVKSSDIESRFLTLSGSNSETGDEVKILCLHPLDCLENRLGNINVLGREDEQAIRSVRASILILDAFIDEMLTKGDIKQAQACFRELERVIRKRCASHKSYEKFKLDPSDITEKYIVDGRLDERYRSKTMAGQLKRARAALGRSAKREQGRAST
jgi:hypothetical protein